MNTKSTIIKAGLAILIASSFIACKPYKYAESDKEYKRLAKGFSKTIAAMPPLNQQIDSLSQPVDFVGTVNMSMRKANYVMIHHTAQDSTAQTLRTFTLKGPATSSHYVIGRDGKVYQMVNDYLRAQHAGVGKWGSVTDMNSSSIGIEMDNNGTTDPWTEAQINSLLTVLGSLKKKYSIPTANFIGHADYAPGRKNDPKNFPWETLAKKGFGYWYDANLEPAPENFDAVAGLRIIGYNIANLPNAINAFKIHFVQDDAQNKTLTERDRAIIYNLVKKYQ
ncbi:MAG: N-acetylmuramoyl-L-alanine amidase [Pedobacter sp.]|nr:MAG: N-acetylmuramoyl-L-alanine amidase [Pedobacter sp.]